MIINHRRKPQEKRRRLAHFSYDAVYTSPGIESRWERDFLHPSKPSVGLTQSPVKWVPSLSPGGKTAGAWRWPPTPSSDAVKERIELYLYSPSAPSWPILGWPLPLPYISINCKCTHHIPIFFSPFTNAYLPMDIWRVIILEAYGCAIWCHVGERALNHLSVACVLICRSFTQPAADIDCGFHESRFFNFDVIRCLKAVTRE